ncbi:Vacuolar import and degradation protein 27 [Dimargaris verticillata]|uniref:Vacuolar import and degradation protein 27 n=1 Tax=Dimargaris verticillata TaxID=2761393 RepID=A0A9W8ED85_9FUNG|nr:Vacuolar import and degradation protein 27 [Dimargaris verticillata]
MFSLKSLGEALFGGEKPVELLVVPTGRLYLARPRSAKGPRECLYKDAMLTVLRTSSAHQYQLVVTRAFDEGEEALEDESDELDDEKVWLIQPGLKFQRRSPTLPPTFVWVDPADDPEESYEFELPDDSGHMFKVVALAAKLEKTVQECLYEAIHQKPHDRASPNALQRLTQPQTPPPQPFTATPNTASPVGCTPLTPTPSSASGPTTRSQRSSPAGTAVSQPAATIVMELAAELYLFDPREEAFINQTEECTVALTKQGPFDHWLWIHENDKTLLTQPLNSDMNGVTNQETCSFIWCYYDDEDFVYTWSLKFDGPVALTRFNEAYTHCLYEVNHQMSYDKVKDADQTYLAQAQLEDIVMTDAFQLHREESASPEDVTDSASDSDDEYTSAADETDVTDESDAETDHSHTNIRGGHPASAQTTKSTTPNAKAKNSLLAVGYKHDRSFVVRGDKIGVFRHTEDDCLEFDTTINDVQRAPGQALDPSKVMLHQEDSSLLIMDKANRHHLYRMDLEYGKVVEDWQVHEDIPTATIAPSSKFAQMTGEQTLVGLSGNSLFRIDPRLKGEKLVNSEFKSYASRPQFSTVATTEKGHVVVGSEKGEIRMFSKLGTVAKTSLPAMGDPILGIDVSADGRYIVATCKNYLLLIHTALKGDAQGRTGFEKAIPRQERLPPVKLQLDPKHIAFMGTFVAFTPAHFNTGPGDREKKIVTSTGPYVISWNFRRVLQGHRYDYQIKKYADQVVADNFRFGQDRAIVVALPQDVTMVTKKQLGAPQKVLQTPVKKLQSRSNIVNSPY